MCSSGQSATGQPPEPRKGGREEGGEGKGEGEEETAFDNMESGEGGHDRNSVQPRHKLVRKQVGRFLPNETLVTVRPRSLSLNNVIIPKLETTNYPHVGDCGEMLQGVDSLEYHAAVRRDSQATDASKYADECQALNQGSSRERCSHRVPGWGAFSGGGNGLALGLDRTHDCTHVSKLRILYKPHCM